MGDVVSFLGAGIYRNYVPSSVFQLVTRGESSVYSIPTGGISGNAAGNVGISNINFRIVGLPIATYRFMTAQLRQQKH